MRNFKTALTLGEVLTTIAILGVVVALGVAGLAQMREKATTRTLQVRIKQLDIAKQQFISEYGRLEAENNWANAADDTARYNFLKRYIDRSPTTLSDFTLKIVQSLLLAPCGITTQVLNPLMTALRYP